jgi:hypothetical protein
MIRLLLKQCILAFLAISLSTVLFAEDHSGHMMPNQSTPELSKPVQKLLMKEMNLIQEGMINLTEATAAGEWKKIKKIAEKISHSYILKRKLTKGQKEELMHKLPEDFKEMDQRFHSDAGMLAHVAEEKKVELISFYIYKMNEACINCHAKYAKNRFPGFEKLNKKKHKH